MKTLLLCLMLLPLRLLAQSDTLTRPASTTVTPALKPIEFRETPAGKYGYYRVYTYDGIDVDDPQHTLWQYMDALNNEDVQYQHTLFDDITVRRASTNATGGLVLGLGFVGFTIGVIQEKDYKAALQQKQKTSPGTTKIDQSDGSGLGIGGLGVILVGTIIMLSAPQGDGAAFLKAVQYYNRALKQKFSWEIQPYSQYGATGFRLVGRF